MIRVRLLAPPPMISSNTKKNLGLIFCFVLFFLSWGVYIPYSLSPAPAKIYEVKKGFGYNDIAQDLRSQGIIKSAPLFEFYVLVSGNHNRLQAGSYDLSPSLSIAQIVTKMANGDVRKNTVTIIEGWNVKDISNYLVSKKISPAKDFLVAASEDFSKDFDFLKDKPKATTLEGFMFPDTYQISSKEATEALVKNMLANFDSKLTPELEKEIASRHKSVFEIVTMASILEKEVKSSHDKKVVAGILWKRKDAGIPLQVDATINYITGKNNSRALIKDTKINSLYNTYQNAGLPLGPICNPGMDSILATVYPQKSDYWYYLSVDGSGKTIFSKTLDEHILARAKYLSSNSK